MTLLYGGYIIRLIKQQDILKEVKDMTSIELKERLEKAQAKVEKCKATIERHKKQAEKKLQKIRENGWDETDRYKYAGGNNYDAYWAICEYDSKLDDIKGAERKLEDAEQIVKNWQERLNKQVAMELQIANEVPEAFKQARAELVERWVEYDIKARDRMLAKKKELSYEEFRKLYRYTEEEDLRHTDEEFRKIEEREADYWLINLYNRVKEITGEVTDCSYIRWGGKGLDGYVVGKKGRANVETIGAGGYNIQRYHLRVLVHKYDK